MRRFLTVAALSGALAVANWWHGASVHASLATKGVKVDATLVGVSHSCLPAARGGTWRTVRFTYLVGGVEISETDEVLCDAPAAANRAWPLWYLPDDPGSFLVHQSPAWFEAPFDLRHALMSPPAVVDLGALDLRSVVSEMSKASEFKAVFSDARDAVNLLERRLADSANEYERKRTCDATRAQLAAAEAAALKLDALVQRFSELVSQDTEEARSVREAMSTAQLQKVEWIRNGFPAVRQQLQDEITRALEQCGDA